jgi:hypothetical protein
VIITNTKINVAIFSNNYGRLCSVLSVLASLSKDNLSITIYTTEEKFKNFSEELNESKWPIGLKVYTNTFPFLSEYQSCNYTLGIVAGFNKVLPESLIANNAMGIINLHAGKLPQYRGGSPLNWQIINGESIIGVTIHQIDSGIDTGPILASGSFPLGCDEGIKEAHQKANLLFLSLLKEVLTVLLVEGRDILPQEAVDRVLRKFGNICPQAAQGSLSWSTTVELPARNIVVALVMGLISKAQTFGNESLNSIVSILSQ